MNDALTIFILSTMAAVILGGYGYTWRATTKAADKSAADIASARTSASAEAQRIQQDFYEYKLHVAQTFATLIHLKESEMRTQTMLRDISNKLDRFIERRGAEG